MRVPFKTLIAASSALAAIAALANAQAPEFPPATVIITSCRDATSPFPVVVEFETPLPIEQLQEDVQHYVVSEKRIYACQVETLETPPAGRSFKWARVITLAPHENHKLELLAIQSYTRQETPVVSSQLVANLLTLETQAVTAVLSTRDFRIAERVELYGHALVPKYVDDLVNRQQAVELVLTDRYRHSDTTLRAEVSRSGSGFELERRGPVIATALYKGRFAGDGDPDVSGVDFEGRVSMTAQAVMTVSVRIEPGAFDASKYKVSRIRLTVPLVLTEAAAMGFGALHEQWQGKKFWSGNSTLQAEADGTYSFVDCDQSSICGKSGLSWADYSDGEGGVGIIWDGRKTSLSITAEYSEDLIDVAVAPPDKPDEPAEAKVFLFFHPGSAGREILGHIADGLFAPPRAEMSEEFIHAVVTREHKDPDVTPAIPEEPAASGNST